MPGSYSMEGNRLRLAFTALGTARIIYFERNTDGLVDEAGGGRLLLPEALKAFRAQAAMEEQKKREDAAANLRKATLERDRQQAEQARAAAALADRKRVANTPTKVISEITFPCQYPTGDTKQVITLTDTSLSYHSQTGGLEKVPFAQLNNIGVGKDADYPNGFYIWVNWQVDNGYGMTHPIDEVIAVRSASERDHFIKSADDALQAWRSTYSDLRIK